MRVGTRSLLFGVHNFLIHPLMVAIAWRKLYGFTWDPRVWVAFVVHDWGYWGLDEFDGPDGDLHPYTGAQIMHFLFDADYMYWYYFTLYHSRFLAKQNGGCPSRLCMADKLAVCYYPTWLFIALGTLSGEIKLFMNEPSQAKHANMGLDYTTKQTFVTAMKSALYKYVLEHKNGDRDDFTIVNNV